MDIAEEVTRLYAKMECCAPREYLVKTVEEVIVRRQRESLQLIIAATYLIISSWKDGIQKSVSAADRKKVMQVYDNRFSSRELNSCIGLVEADLKEIEWFEKNPMAKSRKRKAENGHDRADLARNISGLGIMVWQLPSPLI